MTSLLQYILDPSIQSLSSTRTDINEFNITIKFNYLGANDLSSITIGYRPITIPPKSYHYIEITSWSIKNSPLEITTLLQLNHTFIVSKRTEFMVVVTNSAEQSSTSDSVNELLGKIYHYIMSYHLLYRAPGSSKSTIICIYNN